MSLDQAISLLDTLSKFAEALPFHYVALAGFVMAGVVVALRKYRAAQQGPVAEVVQFPAKQIADAPVAPAAQATLEEITSKTLGPK